MSINACTINNTTIDAICGNRRAAIIQDLLDNGGGGRGSSQHVNPQSRTIWTGMYKRVPDLDYIEENTVDVSTLELPNISVTIEMSGQTFIQNIKRDDNFRPMINVYGIKLSDSVLESVNITDIRIKVL